MPFNEKSDIHYFGLDWLRFASCLTVVVSHERDMFFPAWDAVPPEMKNLPLMFFYLLSRLGHEAVIVFLFYQVFSSVEMYSEECSKIISKRRNLRLTELSGFYCH